MKKAILTLALALACFLAKAQTTETPKSSSVDFGTYNPTPGKELRKASNSMLFGVGFATIGGVVAFTTGQTPNLSKQDYQSGLLAGAIFSAAGIAFMLKGVLHVGKAGRLMESQKTAWKVEPASDGLGVVVKF